MSRPIRPGTALMLQMVGSVYCIFKMLEGAMHRVLKQSFIDLSAKLYIKQQSFTIVYSYYLTLCL